MEDERTIEQSQFLSQTGDRRTFIRRVTIGGGSILLAPALGGCRVLPGNPIPPSTYIDTGNLSPEETVNKLKADFAHVNPDRIEMRKDPGMIPAALNGFKWAGGMARIISGWWESNAELIIVTHESEAAIIGDHQPKVRVTTLADQLVKHTALEVVGAMDKLPPGQLTPQGSRSRRALAIWLDSEELFKSAAAMVMDSGLKVYFQIDKPNSSEVNPDSRRRYDIFPVK